MANFKELENHIDGLIDKYKQQIESMNDLKFSLALEDLIPDIFDNEKITFRLENLNRQGFGGSRLPDRLCKRKLYKITINDIEFNGEEVHDVIFERLKNNPNQQWNLPNKFKK